MLAFAWSVLSVAWQSAPALSIVARVDPAGIVGGELVRFAIEVSNTGGEALEEVIVHALVPQGTALEEAQAGDGWEIEVRREGGGDAVRYSAQNALSPGASTTLVLIVRALQASAQTIVLDEYTATAEGIAPPVRGAPVAASVDVTPTPWSSPSPTDTPVPSPTATASPTATTTAVPTPTLKATSTVTPTPTITVVAVEMPPTPTSNLTSEQERVGTITVSIFLTIVVAVIVLTVVWMIRSARGT
jgi:uncharacterized repeat protein (TIGR01451 family)